MDAKRVDLESAGASARREAAKRRRSRERVNEERHPHIGWALNAAQSESSFERNWRVGAEGEESVAALIHARCPATALVCDRRIPGSRANIDLIAISPSGVLVIDPKRYRGAIKVDRPLFGDAKLRIAGRDRSKLTESLDRQVDTVRGLVDAAFPGIEVGGCLCFVAPEGMLSDSGLPLIRQLTFRGYPLLYPRRLVKRLSEDGPLSPDQVTDIAAVLADRLAPA